MDNNQFQNNQQPVAPSVWATNPHLKMLLLVLIFVLLGCGLFLIVLIQIQNHYRQKIYEEAVAGLPKHQVQKNILADGRLRVDSPKEGDTLGQTFAVSGFAQGWFEATIAANVFDDANNLLYKGSVMASGDNYGQPAPFSGQIILTATSTTIGGKIEFTDYSAKDGKLVYQKVVNIKFADYLVSVDTAGWKTYKNAQYGFEFQYPADWTLNSTPALGKLNVLVYAGFLKGYKHDFMAPDCGYGECIRSLADVNNPNTKGFIHLNNGNGIISLGTTYEGGPPDVPIYSFFTRTSSTEVDVTIQDGTYDCEKTSDLCMGFINGITPGKYAKDAEYSNYNKFLDLLVTYFKFTK